MTVPDEPELLRDLCDGVWGAFRDRGVREGTVQEIFVSWRCPTVAAAEALEAALRAAGGAVGAAQPNAEAGGRGFGVAATVPVLASRAGLEEVVARMVRLGAEHGGAVVGVGTTTHL